MRCEHEVRRFRVAKFDGEIWVAAADLRAALLGPSRRPPMLTQADDEFLDVVEEGAAEEDGRTRKGVPHVPLAALRQALGMTLNDVCQRIQADTGNPVTIGSLSAIERGHRGASLQMLMGLEKALGLPEASLSTSYEPRRSPRREGSS